MKKKLQTLTISVPYKRAGNVIVQQPVTFDVFSDGERFTAQPHLNEAERAVANLPPELQFVMEAGKPVSLRGSRDGNFHVIERIAEQLPAALLEG